MFPSETIGCKGYVGFTIPTVSLSLKTDRFAGYEKSVADTTSNLFNGVLVGVSFNLESVVLDDEFILFLVVVSAHPAASISPITRNKGNGTLSFIEGSVTEYMILML
jgi:hypothetical protein